METMAMHVQRMIWSMMCVVSVVAISVSTSTAASFDCAKAQSKVEKAICNDSELGLLDEQLAAAYKLALKVHPVPGYVKARQRDWLKLRDVYDELPPGELAAQLKKEYRQRIRQLSSTDKLTVYANTTDFKYENGDAVVEFYDVGKDTRISVWGGFTIHRVQSEEMGRDVYTGCEFEGLVQPGSPITAISDDQPVSSIEIEFSGDLVTFPDADFCVGFSGLPEELRKVPGRP